MIELLEEQKKLTVNQWKLICTANLADLLDFFDFFLIGYVTAALTKQWSHDTSASAVVMGGRAPARRSPFHPELSYIRQRRCMAHKRRPSLRRIPCW